MKILACLRQITVKNWRNLPISNPNQISTISMYIQSLAKIQWYLLKLLSGNKNTGMSQADNSIKNWQNLPIRIPNQISTILHISNLVIFTRYCLETKNGWTTDGQKDGRTDGYMDDQRETIIPHHYPVVGYKMYW